MIDLFSIPIWKNTFTEYDPNAVTQIIEDHLEDYGGNEISNQYGLQTKKNLHIVKNLSPIFDFVLFNAKKALLDLQIPQNNVRIIESWGNINKTLNAFNTRHIHQGVLSGAFYVSVPYGSGSIFFNNPGMNCLWYGFMKSQFRNKFNSEAVEMKPENGQLLLFPSFLPHSVQTNFLDVKRVSISFNIISD